MGSAEDSKRSAMDYHFFTFTFFHFVFTFFLQFYFHIFCHHGDHGHHGHHDLNGRAKLPGGIVDDSAIDDNLTMAFSNTHNFIPMVLFVVCGA